MGKIADLIILNIIFLLTCIPIITIGAALASMYEITLKMVKNQEAYIIKSYFKAMKSNLKKGIIAGVIFEMIGGILALDLWIVMSKAGTMWSVITVLLIAITFLAIMLASYFFPLLAKFEDSMKNILKSSFFMAIAYAPVTFGVMIVNCIGLLVLYRFDSYQIIFYGGAIYSIIGFALTAFLNSIMLVNVFEKFYK